MQERLLRVKKRYDEPIFLILLIVALPIAWLVSLVSSTGGLVVILIALVVGFLLQSGTPPVYAMVFMLLTVVKPLGVPALFLVIDENGKVSMITPQNSIQGLIGGHNDSGDSIE